MQAPAIERDPVILSDFINGDAEGPGSTSMALFEATLTSLGVLEAVYNMGGDGQVSFSENDFLAWLDYHKRAQRQPSYETGRGVGEISLLLGLEGPHQIRLETQDQDVLEVGPGIGLFARSLVKYAGSLTLVDDAWGLLDTTLIPTDVEIVNNSIQRADLTEASFDKVFDVFAALTWGADMRSTAMALYKELHVTRTGGSLFAIPLFARLIQRAQMYDQLGVAGSDIPPQDAFRDFRDYTLGRSIIRVMGEGQVLPTFGANIWDTAEDYGFVPEHERYFDSIWGILDKVRPIPATPPDDILRIGYDLQDGNKITSTVSEEINTNVHDLDVSGLNLRAHRAKQKTY